MDKKLKLQAYNNLTKTLGINMYNVYYAESERDRCDFMAHIGQRYNSDWLTEVLVAIAGMIQATILNISKQDYEPQGASVNLLIAEDSFPSEKIDASCNLGRLSQKSSAVHTHLDKSHMTVHTYPEYDGEKSIATVRVDIDVATCGNTTPLRTLNYIIGSFSPDIIIADYKVRGFARSPGGGKYYIDHCIESIQDYIDSGTLALYASSDVNVGKAGIFHTKMVLKDINPKKHVFSAKPGEMTDEGITQIAQVLQREMNEICING